MSCIICEESSSELITVKEKGLSSLIDCSKKRNEDVIYQNLLRLKNENKDVFVHERCRKKFTNKRRISTKNQEKERNTRRSDTLFDWKQNCFYCDGICDVKNPSRNIWHLASTLQVRESVLDTCKLKLRQNADDEWALKVQRRTLECIDFVAAEARYHRSCRLQFENFSMDEPSAKKKRGRTVNSKQMESFSKACKWLENEVTLHSIPEFAKKVAEFSGDEKSYDTRYLKKLLKEHYGSHIAFSNEIGKESIIYFMDMANFIITKKYKERSDDVENESKRIIKTAAKLIKSEIRDKSYSNEFYPTSEDVQNQWIPDSLKLFLSSFTSSEIKKESIGQSIVKSTSPNQIPPLLFALAVEVDHLYGSRWLNDELFKLGFAVSYSEVTRFKQACATANSTDDVIRSISDDSSFTQFVADNVDHNIVTLDGKGSFHGMGIIASTVTARGKLIKDIKVKRPNKLIKVEELLCKATCVPIVEYEFPKQSKFKRIIFKAANEIIHPHDSTKALNLDIAWHASGFFSTVSNPRPNWSGYMQSISKGEHLPNATITLLPIIDLNPSNYTCIYSTLVFVINQCKKLKIVTPTITFDQPLWLKAMEVATEKSLDIVIHLGGFHTLMSFAGSLGSLMDGSGLESMLQIIYGENTVKHMLRGKAISKALRGHNIVESALTIKLLTILFESQSSTLEYEKLTAEEITEIKEIVLSQEIELTEKNTQKLLKLANCLEGLKKYLSGKSRTSKLWVQYINYVGIMREYIRAARSGDWNLSLVSLEKMLNLFAATGHINYAKSGRLYLQLMLDLSFTHPWLHEKLSNDGHHVIRRSDRFWAGLWPDLVIEQVLMRSLKNRGGLTRGRGMTESTRTLWVHSMHSAAAVHHAMTLVTNHHHSTSEQHEELGLSRINRDYNDLLKVLGWLENINPFENVSGELCSLSSGVVANQEINCDNAEEVGFKIHEKLDKQSLSECTIKRADQVKSFATVKNVVQINKQNVNIDPTRLFTRLIVLFERYDDISQYFQYELTPVPTSLFQGDMMRKPNKSLLINSLFGKSFQLIDDADVITSDVNVVDGGALLRKVVWERGTSFAEIAELYRAYTKSKYGKAIVIFDGYEKTPSTKDHEHSRRSSNVCPTIEVRKEAKSIVNQNSFLSNGDNKAQLIKLITPLILSDEGIVKQSKDDADTLIISTALETAEKGKSVTIFGTDTDLIVMLLYHWKVSMKDITVRSEYSTKGGKQNKQLSIQEALSSLTRTVVENVLFLHAFSGCDTTSGIFDKGKGSAVQLLKKSKRAQELATIFNESFKSQDEIGKAGVEFFVLLYGGKRDDSLGTLRHATYMRMAASSAKIVPAKLPPTERSAWFHSLRVYLQICQWRLLRTECGMDPLEWGWRIQNGKMVPIMTDQDVAPEELLLLVRCNCKLVSRNPCATNKCSCRQNGLKCVSACGDCSGNGCNNSNDEIDNDVDMFLDDHEIDCNDKNENADEDDGNAYDNLFEKLFDF